MTGRFLPYGQQVIEDDDVAAVSQVLRSDFLTTGPAVRAFEEAFADAVGARHAIACANGTAALHLIGMGLGLGDDCSVIVPSITFLATANAAHFCGAEIVLCDVDPTTGLITPEALSSAIDRARNRKLVAFAVHLAGQTANFEKLAQICSQRDVILCEDACHAIGSRYRVGASLYSVGSCAHSRAAAFSLHPVKTIAAGEGGVVTTNDDELADRIRCLRSHGMIRDPSLFVDRSLSFEPGGATRPWVYEMHAPGLNYRLTDFQCALAHSQLKKLERFATARKAIAEFYDRELAGLAPLIRPMPRVVGCEPVLHLYQCRIDFDGLGLSRTATMERLLARNIGTQVHYIPLHRQPFYAASTADVGLPGADAFYSGTLSLPLFASMTTNDAIRVVEALGALGPDEKQGTRP